MTAPRVLPRRRLWPAVTALDAIRAAEHRLGVYAGQLLEPQVSELPPLVTAEEAWLP